MDATMLRKEGRGQSTLYLCTDQNVLIVGVYCCHKLIDSTQLINPFITGRNLTPFSLQVFLETDQCIVGGELGDCNVDHSSIDIFWRLQNTALWLPQEYNRHGLSVQWRLLLFHCERKLIVDIILSNNGHTVCSLYICES